MDLIPFTQTILGPDRVEYLRVRATHEQRCKNVFSHVMDPVSSLLVAYRPQNLI